MNLYIENTGYRKAKSLIKKCVHRMSDEPIDLHIRSSRMTSLASLVLLVIACRSIRSIELTQEISKLSYPITLFANAKNSFKLQLVVSKPMTKKLWKKCTRLNGIINILDVSEADNSEWYKRNRNIICLNSGDSGICDANIYSIVSGAPVMCCEVSSCLGKNLYIAANGDLSFCPKHPASSIMSNVNKEEDVFDNARFRDVLDVAIRKRVACSACEYVRLCKGGCVLQPNCAELKKAYDIAINDVNTIIRDSINLSTVPLYKERSVLYYSLMHGGEIDKQTRKGGHVNV